MRQRRIFAAAFWAALASAAATSDLEQLVPNNWTLALDNDWSSVVMFTATHVPCRACGPMATELGVAIQTWNSSNHGNKRVRFFVVEYSKQTHPIFTAHKVQSVPILVFRKQGTDDPLVPLSGAGAGAGDGASLGSSDSVMAASASSTGADLSAARMLKLLHSSGITERRLLPLRSAQEQQPLALAVTVVLAIGFAVVAASPSLQQSWIVFHGSVWLAAAILIHACAISGVVYDVIRGAPMYTTDGQGRLQVVNTSDRQGQTVLEGLLMGGLSLIASLALIGVLRCARRQPSEPAQVLGVLLLLALFVGTYSRYVGMYKAKAGWYSVTRTIPPQWSRGFTGSLAYAGTTAMNMLPAGAVTALHTAANALPS